MVRLWIIAHACYRTRQCKHLQQFVVFVEHAEANVIARARTRHKNAMCVGIKIQRDIRIRKAHRQDAALFQTLGIYRINHFRASAAVSAVPRNCIKTLIVRSEREPLRQDR